MVRDDTDMRDLEDALDAREDAPFDDTAADDAVVPDAEPRCGNGVTEPGEECDGAPDRACSTPCGTPGSQVCDRCVWQPCAAGVEEICNGHDDDCDGRVDEEAWCWVYPQPLGTDVHAVWGAGPNDVWAASENGMVAHWDGEGWAVHVLRTTDAAGELRATPDVYALWGAGSGSSVVWAVGESRPPDLQGLRFVRFVGPGAGGHGVA